MRRTLLLSLILFIVNSGYAQHRVGAAIENGVALNLAEYRKSVMEQISYALHFTVPEITKANIDATATIRFYLKKKDNVPLQIDFKPDSLAVKKIIVNSTIIPVDHCNEHLIIQPRYLQPGPNKMDIVFVAGNGALNRREGYLYALFVPDRARTVFPCFDQPDLKATFSLKLTVPKHWTANSNGKTVDSSVSASGKVFSFAATEWLPTYLFSFAAGDFKTITQPGPPAATMLYRETDTAKIAASMDSIFYWYKKAVSFCESWTGIKHPFQKHGLVAIPDFQFGGMEHPGTILFQNSSFFLNKNATQEQLNSRSGLIAHEVAHYGSATW